MLPLAQLGALRPLFNTEIIELHFADAEELIPAVELLLSPQGKAIAIKSSRSIMLLDYPDRVLSALDVVVASVHSGFKQDEATLTRRIVRAMRNPFVTILGHPTGRLMGQRDAYAVNLDTVFRAAKDTHTAVEINAYPRRLDLCDAAARRARDLGVMLVISTDSHTIAQLDQMVFGLGVARRAWIEPSQVLNCLSRSHVLTWIAQKRKRAGLPVPHQSR